MPPAVLYTVLRLAAFLVPFGVMMLVPVLREYAWLSAIFAALIGLSLSVLFLREPRNGFTAEIAARRRRESAPTDEDVEDAALAQSAPTASDSADERPEQQA